MFQRPGDPRRMPAWRGDCANRGPLVLVQFTTVEIEPKSRPGVLMLVLLQRTVARPRGQGSRRDATLAGELSGAARGAGVLRVWQRGASRHRAPPRPVMKLGLALHLGFVRMSGRRLPSAARGAAAPSRQGARHPRARRRVAARAVLPRPDPVRSPGARLPVAEVQLDDTHQRGALVRVLR
jgi:hypothetical protein